MNNSKRRRENAEARRVAGPTGTPHLMGNRKLRRHHDLVKVVNFLMKAATQAAPKAPEESINA